MKSLSLFVSLLFTGFSFAQIYTPNGTVTGATTNATTNNIGIGITTPLEKLDVVGNIKTTGAFKFSLGGNITADATWIKFDKAMLAANILRTDNHLQVGANGAKFLVNYTTGNVGVGITAPAEKLDVVGNIKTNGAFKFALGGNITADATWIKFDKAMLAANILRTDNHLQVGANGTKFLVNYTTGNVGIGTITPAEKLDVAGNAKINGLLNVVSNITTVTPQKAISIAGPNGLSTNTARSISWDFWAAGSAVINSYRGNSWGTFMQFLTNEEDRGSNIPEVRMHINSNGNIGIGTTMPDEKLTVKGKIHTNEVRVDVLAPIVPDYVFEADYKLKNLSEVATFIKENKHLPEVPSAKEMEQNGLMLAEMNLKLLKKIEELTLYAIEQNKEIATLQERLAKIEAKLK